MSVISNRFFITALEDGTTLHGSLSSNRSLTQAWNGTSAVPNWTDKTKQPTIYLTLLNGTDLVQPDKIQWYHDNVLIDFSNNSLFKQTTYPVTYGGKTVDMPALQIVGNLASGENVDSDTITCTGTYSINNSPVDFSASVNVRISQITANGYLGVIVFPGGSSDITQAGQTLQMYGILYDSNGEACNVDTRGMKTNWYLNDAAQATEGKDYTDSNGTKYPLSGFTVTEGQIVDHAMVRCDFINNGGSVVYSAYASIDDVQDPQFMYIQYAGNNGNAASLRKGETAEFVIWVGKRNDATVDKAYNTFKVKVINAEGVVNTKALNGFGDADSDGFRTLLVTDGKAKVDVPYDTVVALGKNMTGLVYAYSNS